jgi:hypothetical protein
MAIVAAGVARVAEGPQQQRSEDRGACQRDQERQGVHARKLAARADALGPRGCSPGRPQGCVMLVATLGSSESAVAFTPNVPRLPASA